MGTPVWVHWEELDDAKFYWVVTDAFFDQPPRDGCDQDFLQCVSCCRTGAAIKAYYERGGDCIWSAFICTPAINERITCLMGPYDTFAECEVARLG